MDTISFEDFAKLDLKIGTIASVEKIESADKLLKLTVDFGDHKRTIAAGIAQYYKPEELIGKQLPFAVNLEPKILKGVESQGMMLAADEGGKPVLLHPEKEVLSGTKIK